MGECIVDSYGEDGFQSSDGFADWSTFSSADWTEPQQDDNKFPDWTEFKDDNEKESSFTVVETATTELPEKTENGKQVNVQFVFRDCFHDDRVEKESLTLEIPTLFQLLHSKTDLPSQSDEISSKAAHFWCDLQTESEGLRLSGPKPTLHCSEKILKTLDLRHPDTNTSTQIPVLSDLQIEEPEVNPVALIQTKLLPPSQCRNAPGFFYQISQQWLNRNPTKNPFQ